MSKKVIGALLAIVMVLSVFSFTVFAAGDTKYEVADNEYKQTWGLKTNGNKIDVVLTTNYKVGPISFKIDNVASIDSVEVGGGYYAGSTIDRSDDGVILLFPTTGAATPLAGKEMNEAVVASFTYTANSSAQTPKINETAKGSGTTEAINGKLMATRLSGEYVDYSDFYVGQKTVKVYGLDEPWEDDDVTPPAGGDVKLQVKSGVAGVVIDENKTLGGKYDGVVYGIPAKDGGQTKLLNATYYDGFIEAANGGSLEYVKTSLIARPASWGTGTTVNVKDAAGTVIKTYVLVIIGDVDGDSQITTNDITPALNHLMNPYLPDLQIFAANTFAVTRGAEANKIASYYTVDTNDISALLAQVMSGSGFDVAKLAEGQQKYNTNYQ